MRGIRPLAFVFGVLVWLVFVWRLGLLVFLSPSSRCVSFPFIDDLGTPPTRRPYSWKKNSQHGLGFLPKPTAAKEEWADFVRSCAEANPSAAARRKQCMQKCLGNGTPRESARSQLADQQGVADR